MRLPGRTSAPEGSRRQPGLQRLPLRKQRRPGNEGTPLSQVTKAYLDRLEAITQKFEARRVMASSDSVLAAVVDQGTAFRRRCAPAAACPDDDWRAGRVIDPVPAHVGQPPAAWAGAAVDHDSAARRARQAPPDAEPVGEPGGNDELERGARPDDQTGLREDPQRSVAVAGQGGLQRRVSGTDRQRDYAKHDLQRGNYMDYNGPAVVQPIRPVAPYLRSTPEVYV